MRGRPRKWTEKENRLLMELGEKYPQRGELRQHLTVCSLSMFFLVAGFTSVRLILHSPGTLEQQMVNP